MNRIRTFMLIFSAQLLLPVIFWIYYGYPATATSLVWTNWDYLTFIPAYYIPLVMTLATHLIFNFIIVLYYFSLMFIYDEKTAFRSAVLLAFLPPLLIWRVAYFSKGFVYLGLFSGVFFVTVLPVSQWLVKNTSKWIHPLLFIVAFVIGAISLLYGQYLYFLTMASVFWIMLMYRILEHYVHSKSLLLPRAFSIFIVVISFLLYWKGIPLMLTHGYFGLPSMPYYPLYTADIPRFGYFIFGLTAIPGTPFFLPIVSLFFLIYSFREGDVLPFLFLPLFVEGMFWEYFIIQSLLFVPIPIIRTFEFFSRRANMKKWEVVAAVSLIAIAFIGYSTYAVARYAPQYGSNKADYEALIELKDYAATNGNYGKVLVNPEYQGMVKAVSGLETIDIPFWWLRENDAVVNVVRDSASYVIATNRDFRIYQPYEFFTRFDCGDYPQVRVYAIRIPMPLNPCEVFSQQFLPDKMAYMMIYGGNMEHFKTIIEKKYERISLSSGAEQTPFIVRVYIYKQMGVVKC